MNMQALRQRRALTGINQLTFSYVNRGENQANFGNCLKRTHLFSSVLRMRTDRHRPTSAQRIIITMD